MIIQTNLKTHDIYFMVLKVQDFEFFHMSYSIFLVFACFLVFCFRVIFGREIAVICNSYLGEEKNSPARHWESCLATLFGARTLNVKNKIW